MPHINFHTFNKHEKVRKDAKKSKMVPHQTKFAKNQPIEKQNNPFTRSNNCRSFVRIEGYFLTLESKFSIVNEQKGMNYCLQSNYEWRLCQFRQ